jgi:tetratricopeptide (TPR) repeat protein
VRKSVSILLVLVLVASAAAIYVVRVGLDCRRYSGEVREELTYYPSGRLLKVADLGYSALAADVLWLRGIQYYGEHRKTDLRYPLAEHIFSTITNLDPDFIGAYRFGALVLSEDAGSVAGAVDLLRRGLRSNPEAWQIPFDLGFIYFMGLNDYSKAAHYFRLSSQLPGAPEVARRFSAFAYRKSGKPEVAKALWEEMLESSSNEVLREMALDSIKRIDRETTIAALDQAVGRFRSERGRLPGSLAELVSAGSAGAIPPDPLGGSYFLDRDTETVSSTSKAKDEADLATRRLQRLLTQYQESHGAFPESLADLKADGLIAEIPRVAGTKITYDPGSGRVAYRLVGEDRGQ